MTAEALDVIEVRSGRTFIFGGVFAANDGFIAEIHEQKDGNIRRLEKSRALPSREIAMAWMRSRDCFKNCAA